MPRKLTLDWILPGEDFPPVTRAWPATSRAPGLLVAGGSLNAESLQRAYRHGIFPWFSEGQPILWWSPDPRMVLEVANFRLHRSLRKTLIQVRAGGQFEVRFDTAFEQVIAACSSDHVRKQPGTWIGPEIVDAYCELHRNGLAHSVETWIDGQLAGGLYCVGIGQAVFGESMFTRQSNASKIALAALVAFCRQHEIAQIDCQQNTSHLASLGAHEIERKLFLERVQYAAAKPAPHWRFEPLYWQHLLHF